jgi:hypothetical protein
MAQRDHDSTDELLQELLWTYGPCGQEDAVRAVCARELQPLVDDFLLHQCLRADRRGRAGRWASPGRSPSVNNATMCWL